MSRRKRSRIAVLALAQGFVLAWLVAGCTRATEIGSRSGSPLDALPEWISPLLESGMRPDWSPDGRRLMYQDALVGDIHEFDIANSKSRPLTAHFQHRGFSRARYLSSGDVLLCGPGPDSAAGEEGGRWSHTELWFLSKTGKSPAQRLDEPCFEGPAVSRRDMRIAWSRSDYPDELIFARSELWIGRIAVEDGRAQLVERRKLIDRSDFMYLAFVETQDFRPPDETELLFTAYAYKGGEVMGVDLESGEWTNYSLDWAYDEVEGVFPDGRSAAVERELDTYTANPIGDIDIWQLELDGSGRSRRLTYFTEYAGFGANNPVISPDGRYMAFGLRIKGGGHGNGQGILLYDFEKAPK
ncbi:MAG: PD40 domain-containing protein [Deltaproteobacteria bacterium]|nr:PD40 domain-containing protein [Deltaproteobacteria bacterium]MBW2362743.1 PD40 domain-containing protein [Deltaproteobacteria bacterium]